MSDMKQKKLAEQYIKEMIKKASIKNTTKQEVLVVEKELIAEDETLNKLIEINQNNEYIEDIEDSKDSKDNIGYFKLPYDDKFKDELEKDFTNNLLLERMNLELDFRIKGERQKTFDKPYSNENNIFKSNIERNDYMTITDQDRNIAKEQEPKIKEIPKQLGQRKIITN
jgi:hypothetical protein